MSYTGTISGSDLRRNLQYCYC